MHSILDNELPLPPHFIRRTYTIDGEKQELYMRDSLQVLRELYMRRRSSTYSPMEVPKTASGQICIQAGGGGECRYVYAIV